MSQIEVDDRFSEAIRGFSSRLSDLLDSCSCQLVEVASSRPPESQVPGVYLILSPPDGHVVYAGMTQHRNHICRRLGDHRNGNASCDLPVMLSQHAEMPQAIEEYRVKWLEIEDPRDRYLFEQFVVGVLSPELNG